MTPDEQEALSHQHSHGVWAVMLENGKLAVFDHPSGKLLHIWNFPSMELLAAECKAAAIRHDSRKAAEKKVDAIIQGIDLSTLNFDL